MDQQILLDGLGDLNDNKVFCLFVFMKKGKI